MRTKRFKSAWDVLCEMGLSTPQLLRAISQSDLRSTDEVVALLHEYGIDREKYLEILEISHQSRLHLSVTPSVWDKIRSNLIVRSNSPAWLQDIFSQSFEDVSPTVNGLGDFIRRGYGIKSQRERITPEIGEAFYKSQSELFLARESLHSATASIWYELDDHKYMAYRDQEVLHVAIRQTDREPMSSSRNWFFAEMLMPAEELSFFRCNVDLTASYNRNLFEVTESESGTHEKFSPLDVWVQLQNKMLDVPDLPGWVKDVFALSFEEILKLPTYDEVSVPGRSWIDVIRPIAHSSRMNASYIEFLQEQIRINSRGEAWTNILKKRCQALEPHVDEDVLEITVGKGRHFFSLWLFPSAPKELHWEAF